MTVWKRQVDWEETMFRKKGFWIGLLVLALLGGGGYAAYANGLLPWFGSKEATVETATLQTATVSTGSLSITADGSGTLVPSTELNLTFGSSGTLVGLLVKVGDKVQAGDVLAWIDDTDARNALVSAELGVIQAQETLEDAGNTAKLEQAVAQAELKLAQAEANLAAAQADLDDVLNWAPDETEVEIAQVNLTVAQASYQNTAAKVAMRDQELASTRIKLEEAIRNLQSAQASYVNAMDSARDWERNIESTRERAAESLRDAQNNLEITQASYDLAMIDTSAIDIQNARVKVINAQQALDDLQTPPDEETIAAARILVQELEVSLAQAKLDLAEAQQALADVDTTEAELALQQARLKLESAQKTLDGATLIAPTGRARAWTVTAVNAEVGENVNGAVMTLANLNEPVIQFWVEESDLNHVAVGHRVHIVFEAFPELTYSGEIISVEPVLVTMGNTTAVQAWASIDVSANPVTLLGNMNAEVEIVAGEALNVPLVPVQALREIADGQYAAFVVLPDGELEMRMVQVGLMDYVNAEVRSGLQPGETVALGESDSSSKSTTVNSSDMEPGFSFPGQGGGGGMPPMMPGG